MQAFLLAPIVLHRKSFPYARNSTMEHSVTHYRQASEGEITKMRQRIHYWQENHNTLSWHHFSSEGKINGKAEFSESFFAKMLFKVEKSEEQESVNAFVCTMPRLFTNAQHAYENEPSAALAPVHFARFLCCPVLVSSLQSRVGAVVSEGPSIASLKTEGNNAHFRCKVEHNTSKSTWTKEKVHTKVIGGCPRTLRCHIRTTSIYHACYDKRRGKGPTNKKQSQQRMPWGLFNTSVQSSLISRTSPNWYLNRHCRRKRSNHITLAPAK